MDSLVKRDSTIGHDRLVFFYRVLICQRFGAGGTSSSLTCEIHSLISLLRSQLDENIRNWFHPFTVGNRVCARRGLETRPCEMARPALLSWNASILADGDDERIVLQFLLLGQFPHSRLPGTKLNLLTWR